MEQKLPNWLVDAIKEFSGANSHWSSALTAEGSCWSASKQFKDFLREAKMPMKAHVQYLCFDNCKKSDCWERKRTGYVHSHDVKKFFPFPLDRMPRYDGDHRYNFLSLLKEGIRVNIDFTARQFSPSLPYPLVWIHGEKDPIHV